MKFRAVLTGLLMVAGVGLVGSGLMQPAKALLGQVLLNAAFAHGGVQPWPGADMKPVARMHFDRLGVSRIILDQASGEGMAWGPGIVVGTSIPGDPGSSVVAGHRDTHMAFLQKLRIGDTLTIESLDGRVTGFKVGRAIVVDGSRWKMPIDERGQAMIYLTTCWPFGVQETGKKRFVVMAHKQADKFNDVL